MPGRYLTVPDTWTTLEGLAWAYDLWTEIIDAPEVTTNGHTPLILRFRAGYRPENPRARQGVLFLGSIHAREWGSTDILVSLLDQMLYWYCDSYIRSNDETPEPITDLTFGNKTYPGPGFYQALREVDLFVMPIVNPDGREYSFEDDDPVVIQQGGRSKIWWRKNRALTPIPGAIGIDLNRNFDFLWDFQTHFHPDSLGYSCWARVSVSDSPRDPTFHGESPFSEIETRNIRWLLDVFPHIRFLVDIHCRGQMLLTPWGDDEIQTTDPEMNFANPTFDGLRGLSDTYFQNWGSCASQEPHPEGPSFTEYLDPVDQSRLAAFSQACKQTISQVASRVYTTGPGYTVLYGISGSSKDYAQSRHIADPCQSKVDGHLIEWGTQFQPPYEEPPGPDQMTPIITDVSAGLCEFILQATRIPVIDITPCLLDFGIIRIGEHHQQTLRINNIGPIGSDPVNIVDIRQQISDPQSAFSLTFTPNTVLNPGEYIDLVVTYTPTSQSISSARLLIAFEYAGETVQDSRLVILSGEGCEAPEGLCYAPVFDPRPALVCLLLLITAPLVIAGMVIGICIHPGIYCALMKYLYYIGHCSSGNKNPCVSLGPVRTRPCLRRARVLLPKRRLHRDPRAGSPGRPGRKPRRPRPPRPPRPPR